MRRSGHCRPREMNNNLIKMLENLKTFLVKDYLVPSVKRLIEFFCSAILFTKNSDDQ